MDGFTYSWNQLAKDEVLPKEGNYDGRNSGVSAQAVQAVLPEAVKPAPGNGDYLTVQYDKLVPLLIESIKELKSEIDELKKGKQDRLIK